MSRPRARRRTAEPSLGAALIAAIMLGGCARSGPPAPLVDHTRLTNLPPAVTDRARVPAPPRPAQGVHIVEGGDSVYRIARFYGVPLRAVIDANRLAPPYLLPLGTRLAIPAPRVHVVRSGETIYGISRAYGVDAATLVRLNEIAPPHTIYVAQRLVVQVPTAIADPVPPPAPRPEFRPAPSELAALARPIGDPPPLAEDGFLTPVPGRVVSTFGAKEDGLHNDGINIAAARGTPVRAAQSGVIAYAGDKIRGYGKLLLIKHTGGYVTAYAHNDRLLVDRGDVVRRGQVVATVGSTGDTRMPQLHFEIRHGARAVNPQIHLAAAR